MMMCHECHCILKLRPAFSSIFHGWVMVQSPSFPKNSPAFPRHFPNIFPQVGRHSCAVDFLRASGFLEADDAEAEAEELSGWMVVECHDFWWFGTWILWLSMIYVVEPPFGLRLLLPFWCRRGGYWCTAGARKRKIGARVGLGREK